MSDKAMNPKDAYIWLEGQAYLAGFFNNEKIVELLEVEEDTDPFEVSWRKAYDELDGWLKEGQYDIPPRPRILPDPKTEANEVVMITKDAYQWLADQTGCFNSENPPPIWLVEVESSEPFSNYWSRAYNKLNAWLVEREWDIPQLPPLFPKPDVSGPRSVTITIPDERPMSWNKMYAGLHWNKRKKEVDRVHALVKNFIPLIPPTSLMFMRLVDIEVVVYFPDNQVRLDASNIMAKLYEDALIGAILKNDSWREVRSMKTVTLLDREKPRTEITITEYED